MRESRWVAVYRQMLRVLPVGQRQKHGDAMVALFARELEAARIAGAGRPTFAAIRGVLDLAARGLVERLRVGHSAGERIVTPLRDVSAAFAVSLGALTVAFLGLNAMRLVPRLLERGASAGAIVEVLLLALPFTLAMTLPMAVLLAVLTAARYSVRRVDHRTHRSTSASRATSASGFSTLAAALIVAIGVLTLTTRVVPHTNARLSSVLSDGVEVTSARTMTPSALRAAVHAAPSPGDADAPARRAAFVVELHKPYVLAAACLVLALVGVAINRRVPGGGMGLVTAATLAVYAAYYQMLTVGEQLAVAQRVPPAMGMWSANLLLGAAALLVLVGRSRSAGAASRVVHD